MERPARGKPPEQPRMTWSVSPSTSSWMRPLAAAEEPSTARKALVMATLILLASNPLTLPFRRMTRISPGALARSSTSTEGCPGGKACDLDDWDKDSDSIGWHLGLNMAERS